MNRPQKGVLHFEDNLRNQAVLKPLHSFSGLKIIPFLLFLLCTSWTHANMPTIQGGLVSRAAVGPDEAAGG